MVAAIVVDNSALLPLAVPDESKALIQLLLTQARNGEVYLIAPSLCVIEYGNSIVSCIRRKRMTITEAAVAHAQLPELPIEFFEYDTANHLSQIHTLAMRHSLSFYDALYLAVAIERNATLATQDKALHHAAVQEGIAFVG